MNLEAICTSQRNWALILLMLAKIQSCFMKKAGTFPWILCQERSIIFGQKSQLIRTDCQDPQKGLILLLIIFKGNLDIEICSARIDGGMVNPFLDFLLYMEGQVLWIYHHRSTPLKLVRIDFCFFVIKELPVDVGALGFLIHFNRVLEEKVVLREMNFFRSFLRETADLFSEHLERKDLASGFIRVASEAEYVIDLFVVVDYPIRCCMSRNFDFTEPIKSIRIPATGSYSRMYNVAVLNVARTLRHMKLDASMIHDVVMGLNDLLVTIINQLAKVSLQLHIVLILGMPGIGKITLTKEVQHDPSVGKRIKLHAYNRTGFMLEI